MKPEIFLDTGKTHQCREFMITVIKMAVFCAALLLNMRLLCLVFIYPIALIKQCLGSGASYEALYTLNWIANDLGSYVIPALAAFFLFRNDPSKTKLYEKKQNYKPYVMMPLIFLSSCFAGSMANIITTRISKIIDSIFGTGEIPDAMVNTLPSSGTAGSFMIFLFFIIIAAPVCEELIFRKLLLQPLRKHGDGFAIFVSAIFFGFFHGNWDQFPYAVTVGLLYGLLAVSANSIIPTLILHFLNNVLVSLGSYLTVIAGETPLTLAVSNGVNLALGIAFWLGIPATVIIFVLKMHRPDRIPALSMKEKAAELFKNPAFYIMAALLALMMI